MVFWGGYALYFTMQSYACSITGYLNDRAIYNALYSSYCYLPFCILSVYIFSYLLFPFFLQKKKYTAFAAGVILVVALGLLINYFQTELFFQLTSVDRVTVAKKLMLGYNNVCNAVVISCFVLGIKLAKIWYAQQKENFLLAEQKSIKELHLFKSRIHPDFLFSSMDSLYQKIHLGSEDSPIIILKLSELISYILYESDQELVPLEKELTSISEFIAVFKLIVDDPSKLNLEVTGNTNNKRIAPLILLTIVQNCLALLDIYSKNRQKADIAIAIVNEELILKLSFCNLPKNSSQDLHTLLQSERIRLDGLYPDKYFLNLSERDNSSELTINILLSKPDVFPEKYTLKSIENSVYESV